VRILKVGGVLSYYDYTNLYFFFLLIR